MAACAIHESITMKSKSNTDSMKFPSGRTVKRCKDDAKAMRKASKATNTYISYNQALNIIAQQNGINLPWDKAISKIASYHNNKSDLFNSLKGKYLNRQSEFKKQVNKRFLCDGRIMLPDGEGGQLEVIQHRSRTNGLLMTESVIKLVEDDIEALGGLQNLKLFEDSSIQLFYEKKGAKNYLAYEFHITGDGVIHYFCRSQPWNGYKAELHARGYSITNVGYGERAADTALHWLGFELFHPVLTPRLA